MGINFGRLGFLASIGKDELTLAVEALANGRYVTEKRTLLHLDVKYSHIWRYTICTK